MKRALALTLAAVACADPPVDPACPAYPITVPLPSPLPAPLASLLQGIEAGLANSTMAGVAAQISYKGATIASFSSGLANVTGNVPFTVSTPSRAGSVSKVFTALLAMQLVAKGLLDLDDPIVKYVPGFSVVDPFGNNSGKDITFRHLMSHTAGLQRETPPGFNTTADLLPALAQTWLIWPVGTIPSYSNLGFSLLGNVLAGYVVPGATYADLIAQYVTQPLGLANTGYHYTPAVMEELAVGYFPSASGPVPQPFQALGWSDPAGGVYTSVQDLSTLTNAIMDAALDRPNKLGLPPTLAREFMGPVFINPDGLTGFSLPWELRVTANYTIRNKGGNIGGYTALTSFVPALDLSVNILWNTAGPDEFAASGEVYPPLLVVLEEILFSLAPGPDNGPSPGDYVGTYTATFPSPVTLVVLEAKGYIILLIPHNGGGYTGVPIAWVANDRYRAFFPPFTVPCFAAEVQAFANQYLVFQRGASGSVTGLEIGGYYPGFNFVRTNSTALPEGALAAAEEAAAASHALARGKAAPASFKLPPRSHRIDATSLF